MTKTTGCRATSRDKSNRENAPTPPEEHFVNDPDAKKAVLCKLHELRDALLDLGSAWQSYEFTRADASEAEKNRCAD